MKIGGKDVIWIHGETPRDVAIEQEATERSGEFFMVQYELATIGNDGVERMVRWSTPKNRSLADAVAEAESYADYILGRQHDRYGLVTAILQTNLGWTPA